MNVGGTMANIAMRAFPPPINIPPVNKASEASLGSVAPCSEGQSTVQSAKGKKNSLFHETG